MAFQPSVAEYFNKRKRPAVEDAKRVLNASKVLVLDESARKLKDGQGSSETNPSFVKKLVFKSEELDKIPKKAKSASVIKSSKASRKKILKSDSSQLDIRKTLIKSASKKTEEEGSANSSETTSAKYPKMIYVSSKLKKSLFVNLQAKDDSTPNKESSKKTYEPTVPFHICGPLSPAKKGKEAKITSQSSEGKNIDQNQFVPEPNGPSTNQNDEEKKVEIIEKVLKTPEATTISRKELNLGNLKAMLSRSSRLEEMKAALMRYNNKKAEMLEAVQSTSGNSHEIEFDIPVPSSPIKTPKKASVPASPLFKMTPSRLFDTPPPVQSSPIKSPFKSPAYQRYQSLVTEGRPALVLPFKYRALAETFRCVDTVASMLHNRKETITLSKLRPGVQEISRKNLTEYELGQIKAIFPNAFEFKIEKMRSLGSAEKYELVINPKLDEFCKGLEKGEENDQHIMMSPTVLLARRRFLFKALLEQTKDHHEDFLNSLDPPMKIPRDRLTRWHPQFSADEVPDIISEPLPQPPNVEKVTSAKDVLERARNLFMVNPRMERALKKLSESNSSATPNLTPPTAIETPPLLPALQGLPACLLEKIRAKQAARAMEAMTRTPAQAKEAVRLTRLPEIARIIRNLFVAEKKGVLPRDQVLQKLGDSYRESLSRGELDDHLTLLAEKTPGWITFYTLRKTDYVKLSRGADMSRVMTRLEELAADKSL